VTAELLVWIKRIVVAELDTDSGVSGLNIASFATLQHCRRRLLERAGWHKQRPIIVRHANGIIFYTAKCERQRLERR